MTGVQINARSRGSLGQGDDVDLPQRYVYFGCFLASYMTADVYAGPWPSASRCSLSFGGALSAHSIAIMTFVLITSSGRWPCRELWLSQEQVGDVLVATGDSGAGRYFRRYAGVRVEQADI